MDPPLPPAAGTPSSAAPSSPHPGLSPLRRALLPASSESSRRGSPKARPRPPRSWPAPAGSSARRRPRPAAHHAPLRRGKRPGGGGRAGGGAASDPAEAYSDTDAEALAAVAALPPFTTFPMAFSVQLLNLVVLSYLNCKGTNIHGFVCAVRAECLLWPRLRHRHRHAANDVGMW
ncbi:translation initiation factor IF-2 [Triticum aestivum]|uniref:translation initiation factor IF-2 n=1 Tax=Triticum aestivum TaxID=4565 RepID=UPI001D02FF54|nr:translation initiation factor IF-2-like [Triticum aestivum]